MAEIVLFHHAMGLTDGVRAFAEELRTANHVVHVPDLYDGHTFGSLDEGIGYAKKIGFDEVMDRGVQTASELSDELVYAGFSLGVMPAQQLAQTRPGARGALLFDACAPATEFADRWPAGVPVQIHGMDADPFFAEEGDLDAARQLVEGAPPGTPAELFTYPGDQHLFADRSLPSYDAAATALLTDRVLTFLNRMQ